MPSYNYAALSHQDFEEITRDLLQAEWNVAIEAFKAGRDAGIDLRYAIVPGKTVIVQCKHFIRSGFAALLRHLRDSELPKVVRLNPSRYVVVTSVGLTPANKDEIVQTLSPYVRSAEDVIGVNDIDGLLSRHPKVERANFKLWLTSTSVIDRVLHNAELCHTEFEVDRIRQKLPLLVQNDAYPRAQEKLTSNRIVVISGPPGIGKTTLAEMLLYSNIEEGYAPMVIQGDISEGKKLYRHGERQIFYYDDFLGQTFLGDRKEYFGRNQDKAVIEFMEMVVGSPYSRFILTTREHILTSAIQLSERIDSSTLVRDRIVLTLGHYSFGDRARMVYNHLYFSSLPQAHKEEVLRGDFFLRIIKHPHFNPRLIEWLASLQRVGEVHASDYPLYVQDLLDNPTKIWEHAFRNQISEGGRSLLLALYAAGGGENPVDLEPIFTSLHAVKARKYNHQTRPRDFEEALRTLEGAFLSITFKRVDFLNPSVKEYVASTISNEWQTFDDLVSSAIRFKQLVNLWRLARTAGNAVIRQHLAQHLDAFISKLLTLVALPDYRWESTSDGRVKGHLIDFGTEGRLGFLAEFCNEESSVPGIDKVLDTMADVIEKWNPRLVSLWFTQDLLQQMTTLEWFMVNGGERICSLLLDKLLISLPHARARHWKRLIDMPERTPSWQQKNGQRFHEGLRAYMEEGWKEEWDSCESARDRKELVENLAELATKKRRGRYFSAAHMSLSEVLAAVGEEHDEPERGDGAPTPAIEALRGKSLTEDEVRDMFQTLVASA